MTFESPTLLWLLLGAPAVVGIYIFAQRRKVQQALRYPSLMLIRPAISRTHALRRHLPPLLLLVAIISLVLAVARPTVPVTAVSSHRTIMLVIDVSLSMASTDIPPNRFAAAQAAAKAFIEEQPSDVRVGLVSFAGVAAVVQVPTVNRHDLTNAIDNLHLDQETAIGSGLIVALGALLPNVSLHGSDPMFDSTTTREEHRITWTAYPNGEGTTVPKSATAGAQPSAAIILLSDGASNTGIDPRAVATIAANHGIRCFTVGFGSKEEASADDEGSILPGFDEDTLRAIADITGAEYFQAATAEGLHEVFQFLRAQALSEKHRTEITALFTAVAAVLSLVSVGLSLAWFNRPS
ncbi:MAG: transporter ATP-binding protein [Betaproteobacteria bacterium]|nr:transporter ATP-binding protein [Betaproteobacteria bacterium]